MSLRAFMAHEWQIQSRSLRSRFVAVAWIGATLAPPVGAMLAAAASSSRQASGILALLLHATLPFAAFICSAALSIDGISRERDEGSLTVLGLAPLTNAGYILRRWLALCVPCVALSAIPPLAAMALAASWADTDVVPGAFLWPWLLRAVPAAILGCAIGLAFGTFAGGTIMAVVQALLVGALILSFGNDFLALSFRKLEGPGDFLKMESAAGAIQWLFGGRSLGGIRASDALVDVREELTESFVQLTFLAMLASASLALSILFLRRSQPDVRPWRIRPDHPLRGFLGWLNRIRLSALPDPGLTRIDLVAMGGLMLVAAAFGAHGAWRFDRYRAIGAEQHRVLRSGAPLPTAQALTTTSWQVTGRLERDGGYAGDFEIALSNEGDQHQERVACSLGVGIEVLDLGASGREIRSTRSLNRLEITLAPGIPPGDTVVLRGRVGGRASWRVFPRVWTARSFVQYWDTIETASLPNELVDLSRAVTIRAASPSGIWLKAESFAPVPRYETWKLQSVGEGYWARLEVPDDDIATTTEAVLDIEVPADVFLADTCGHAALPARAREPRALAGSCRIALPGLVFHGGRLATLPVAPDSIAAIAVLPGHAAAMQLHLPQLGSACSAARTAWPGASVPEAVVVEVPTDVRTPIYVFNTNIGGTRSDGSVLLIDERRILAQEPLETASLATEAVARALLGRRPVDATQGRFFRRFYGALAESRLGAGAERAVMQSEGHPPSRYAVKLLGAGWSAELAWGVRLPALIRTLRAQVGDERLARAVNAFLERRGTGNARELFEVLSEETGMPLAQFFMDFVAGEAVPVLTLEDVTFTEAAPGWRARGFVHNTGSGTVTCSVVARTDSAPADMAVTVGSGQRIAFDLATANRPRLVLLDPLGDCFRYRPKNGIGIIERVEHAGRN